MGQEVNEASMHNASIVQSPYTRFVVQFNAWTYSLWYCIMLHHTCAYPPWLTAWLHYNSKCFTSTTMGWGHAKKLYGESRGWNKVGLACGPIVLKTWFTRTRLEKMHFLPRTKSKFPEVLLNFFPFLYVFLYFRSKISLQMSKFPENQVPKFPIFSRHGKDHKMYQGPKWSMEMLAHFNTWCKKLTRYQKNQIWPWKKLRALYCLIPGAQMALETFGSFWPLRESTEYRYRESTEIAGKYDKVLHITHQTWPMLLHFSGLFTRSRGGLCVTIQHASKWQ